MPLVQARSATTRLPSAFVFAVASAYAASRVPVILVGAIDPRYGTGLALCY
jgi:hypothetical protein